MLVMLFPTYFVLCSAAILREIFLVQHWELLLGLHLCHTNCNDGIFYKFLLLRITIKSCILLKQQLIDYQANFVSCQYLKNFSSFLFYEKQLFHAVTTEEIFLFYAEIHTKHITAPSWRNVEFANVRSVYIQQPLTLEWYCSSYGTHAELSLGHTIEFWKET